MRAPYSLRTICLCFLTLVSFFLTGELFTRVSRSERTCINLPQPDMASARSISPPSRVSVRIVADVVATETRAADQGYTMAQPSRPATPIPVTPEQTPTPPPYAPQSRDVVVLSVVLPAPYTDYDYMITPLPEMTEDGILVVGSITPTLRMDIASALITPVLSADTVVIDPTPSPLDSPISTPIPTPSNSPLISPLYSPLSLP